MDFLVTGKLSTTEGESTILKDIFWRRYAFKFYRLHCHTLSKCVAFHLSGLIHVASNFLCEWMPCYILNRHVAFCQYGKTSYVFKCVFCVNVLLHLKQAWRFSPVWINLWVFKLPTRENVLAHFEQTWGFSHETEYGFTPVWINSCLFKVPYCVNVLSHFEQPCGFLPVRISSCVFKYAFCVNVFSHFEQACGFSPVWITSYFFKCVFC